MGPRHGKPFLGEDRAHSGGTFCEGSAGACDAVRYEDLMGTRRCGWQAQQPSPNEKPEIQSLLSRKPAVVGRPDRRPETVRESKPAATQRAADSTHEQPWVNDTG